MRTYDEAFEAATDRPAFANGYEGEHWMAQWCGACAHDLNIDEGGCPLVMVALMSRTPAEFVAGQTDEQGHVSLPQQYRCVEFTPADSA